MSPTRNLRPEAETLKLALEAEAGLEESAQQGNPKQTGILCFFVFYWIYFCFVLSASGLSLLVCCLLSASWLLGFPSWFAVFLASTFSFLALKLFGFLASSPLLSGFVAFVGFRPKFSSWVHSEELSASGANCRTSFTPWGFRLVMQGLSVCGSVHFLSCSCRVSRGGSARQLLLQSSSLTSLPRLCELGLLFLVSISVKTFSGLQLVTSA